MFEPETEVPLYGEEERPEALEALQLSSADGTLWGAAGAKRTEGGTPGQVTVVRRVEGFWSQLVGPEHPLEPLFSDLSEEEALLGRKTKPQEVVAREATVSAIAAEPGGAGAWIALAPPEGKGSLLTERAVLAHISGTGTPRRSPGAALELRTGTGGRVQGRRVKARLPSRERLLAGHRPGLALSPRPRKRTPAARKRNAGL